MQKREFETIISEQLTLFKNLKEEFISKQEYEVRANLRGIEKYLIDIMKVIEKEKMENIQSLTYEKKYESEHSILMNEWRRKYINQAFIEDGIVHFPTWEKQEKKILILLKEAYNSESIIKDLFENEPFHNIWQTTARYIKALELTKSNYLPTLEEVNNYEPQILQKIAILNIKKADGKNISDYKELKSIAADDIELIKKQINLIKPNIIICGGTKCFFDDIFWQSIGFNKYPIPETDEIIYTSQNAVLLDISHPSHRVSNLMKHYLFAGVYQKYLQQI